MVVFIFYLYGGVDHVMVWVDWIFFVVVVDVFEVEDGFEVFVVE